MAVFITPKLVVEAIIKSLYYRFELPGWMVVVCSDARGRCFDPGAKSYFWPALHPPFGGYLSPMLSTAASLMAVSVSGRPFAQDASDRTRLCIALLEILFQGHHPDARVNRTKFLIGGGAARETRRAEFPLATDPSTPSQYQTVFKSASTPGENDTEVKRKSKRKRTMN